MEYGLGDGVSFPTITGPTYPQPGYPVGPYPSAATGHGSHFLPSEPGYTNAGVYPDPEQVGIGPGTFPLWGFSHGIRAIGGKDLAAGPSGTDASPSGTTQDTTANLLDNTTSDRRKPLPFDGEDGNNHGSEFVIYGMDDGAHESGSSVPDNALLAGQIDGATEETSEEAGFWDKLFEHALAQLIPAWARHGEDEEIED